MIHRGFKGISKHSLRESYGQHYKPRKTETKLLAKPGLCVYRRSSFESAVTAYPLTSLLSTKIAIKRSTITTPTAIQSCVRLTSTVASTFSGRGKRAR